MVQGCQAPSRTDLWSVVPTFPKSLRRPKNLDPREWICELSRLLSCRLVPLRLELLRRGEKPEGSADVRKNHRPEECRASLNSCFGRVFTMTPSILSSFGWWLFDNQSVPIDR